MWWFLFGSEICIIIYIIIGIVACYVFYRIFRWLFTIISCRYHHFKYPDRPKLKRGHLKGYLESNYGKKKGKSIFKEIVKSLKEIGIK